VNCGDETAKDLRIKAPVSPSIDDDE